MTPVRVDPRFCGPPGIGQGGYVAGLLAEALGGSDVIVSLRAPAPLGRDLALDRDAQGARLTDGGTLLAEARRETLHLEVPPAPTPEQAAAASERFDRDAHLYPGYFAIAAQAGKALLAQIHGHLAAPVPAGEALVIQGWALGSEGRKRRAATALHDARGKLLAFTRQLWVTVG